MFISTSSFSRQSLFKPLSSIFHHSSAFWNPFPSRFYSCEDKLSLLHPFSFNTRTGTGSVRFTSQKYVHVLIHIPSVLHTLVMKYSFHRTEYIVRVYLLCLRHMYVHVLSLPPFLNSGIDSDHPKRLSNL